MRSGTAALQLVRQSLACQQSFLRGLSQVAETPAPAGDASHVGESLKLADDPAAPLLLRLPKRPFGPAAVLSQDAVRAASGGTAGTRVSVVRYAFSPFDVSMQPLPQVLRSLGGHRVAVASQLTQTGERLVVDDYEAVPAEEGGVAGDYQLRGVSTDLLHFLRREGLQACLVPDVAAAESHNSVVAASAGLQQSTNQVLMVAPTAFGFNEEAAQDNSFMHTAETAAKGSPLTRRVLQEFAGLYHQLTEVAGVKVHLFQHDLSHGTPDAVFPNNWFSTHYAGEAAGGVTQRSLVLYPMKCPNRARERRADTLGVLRTLGYSHEVDLAHAEQAGRYFEGTGALVLDRVHGTAYVDVSERADPLLAEEWADALGYPEVVTFRASDARAKSVYHTNVMMAVGTGVAVVCAEAVADAGERRRLLQALGRRHEVVQISLSQMDALCGNVLELQDGRGLPVLAMSTQAYNAFTEDQRRVMRRHVAELVHAPIDTLERVGGGGVRCTLAEIF